MKKQATKKTTIKKALPPKKIKLSVGLPAMTETEWYEMAMRMYPTLKDYMKKGVKNPIFEDSVKLYKKIITTFKIKTI